MCVCVSHLLCVRARVCVCGPRVSCVCAGGVGARVVSELVHLGRGDGQQGLALCLQAVHVSLFQQLSHWKLELPALFHSAAPLPLPLPMSLCESCVPFAGRV